ncbi:unnamed protein product [Effrenium voratum]|nr:unnamed protein product [Effrenium voratum]
MASNIKVFLRVRPGKAAPGFKANSEQGVVSFELEKTSPEHEVNNQKTLYNFQFDGVMGMDTKQQDVLDIVARPVVEDVLKGVNGTIFAYGQTGSGKTFTITGGTEHYEQRGLIPRTLRLMFEAFRKGPAQYRMYISYLEIYQDSGYDLLRDDSARKLEDLPKVVQREDEDGNMHLRNLSVNLAASEEDALNLLFLGDTNRVVAETPMNDASTRSHCLFIIWVDSTQEGSDVVRRSKLHLVDLAGSERVSQTGVNGKLLQEAKAINLSLHHLERVIVALHSRTKGTQVHVPYRDSMMTSVLRDSLGGNCRTTMVGCIAAEASNLAESISTCRFAQRVAQITNNARVNEELDPSLLIARLKREVSELKEEVRVARMSEDGQESEVITPEALDHCKALVQQYVAKGVESEEPFMCGSIERLRASFKILRDMCLDHPGELPAADEGRAAALEAEIKKMKLEVAQRDQEIAVMVKMLTKQRGAERPFIAAHQATQPAPTVELNQTRPLVTQAAESSPLAATTKVPEASPKAPEAKAGSSAALPKSAKTAAARATQPSMSPEEAADLLLDKQKALEVFWDKVYKPPEAFKENKALLKDKIEEAQAIGKEALQLKTDIDSVKTKLLRLRTERAMTAAGNDSAVEDGPEEAAEVQAIERLKGLYREKTAELRRVKSDVEGIQKMLEQNQAKVRREFENWFSGLRGRAHMSRLDEEKKKELFDKVTGSSGAGTPVSKEGAPEKVSPSATSASKIVLSMPPSGTAASEENMAAYYAAFGELSRRG